MSLYLYDEALMTKLKKWGIDKVATVLSPDDVQTTFRTLYDTNNDKEISLPLVTLNRNGSYTITNTPRRPLSYNGLTIDRTKYKIETLNAIPIELDYQLDIFTRYRKEADEFARELTFNLINYPQLIIEIPYEDTHYLHTASISLQGEVVDNSAIQERLIHGQFTRYTMKFKVTDAYLFDVRIRDTIQAIQYSIEQDNIRQTTIVTEEESGD